MSAKAEGLKSEASVQYYNILVYFSDGQLAKSIHFHSVVAALAPTISSMQSRVAGSQQFKRA
jgi:hypothetical protein